MAFEKQNDGGRWINATGQTENAALVIAVAGDGGAIGAKKRYTLLTAATTTGGLVGPIDGGDYLWRAEAANWNGQTATLQFLGLDGLTWYNVRNAANTADVTLTSNGSVGIIIAQGAIMRVLLSGAVVAMNSAIGGV